MKIKLIGEKGLLLLIYKKNIFFKVEILKLVSFLREGENYYLQSSKRKWVGLLYNCFQ